jgi:diguanylate cyclase (GGDEF)-like protein
VLRGFATVVRQLLDKESDCIRWGGEEFMVLTSIQTLPELTALAEKIRLQVERTPMAGHKLTCSLGITLWQTDADTSAKLFKRVDDALYQAKKTGRNRVMVQLE